MALRYPNRTGEVGTYSAGEVILSDIALSGMRSFAAAAAAEQIASFDYVGLYLTTPGDISNWIVAMAQYLNGGTLIIDEIESSAGTINDGATVEVTAVLTAKMLDSASLSYEPPWPVTD